MNCVNWHTTMASRYLPPLSVVWQKKLSFVSDPIRPFPGVSVLLRCSSETARTYISCTMAHCKFTLAEANIDLIAFLIDFSPGYST